VYYKAETLSWASICAPPSSSASATSLLPLAAASISGVTPLYQYNNYSSHQYRTQLGYLADQVHVAASLNQIRNTAGHCSDGRAAVVKQSLLERTSTINLPPSRPSLHTSAATKVWKASNTTMHTSSLPDRHASFRTSELPCPPLGLTC
jgi:hypothetical protein